MFAPVAFTGAFHGEISPLPLAIRPIEGLEFAHEKVAPLGLLTKIEGTSWLPGQAEMLDKFVITATGLTITEALTGLPWQPATLGVIVYATEPTVFEVLISVFTIPVPDEFVFPETPCEAVEVQE